MSVSGWPLLGFGTADNGGGGGPIPDIPLLSVADNQNGTASATLSGSTAGATNLVRIARWGGNTGSLSGWTDAGSRSGDGAVTIAALPGYYMAYAQSTLVDQTVASVPAYFRISTGEAAVLYRILEAVKDRLRAMEFVPQGRENVAPIAVQNVDLFEVSQMDGRTTPRIDITQPLAIPMNGAEGVNALDDTGYPILLQIADDHAGDQRGRLQTYTMWQQQIVRAFHNQRLTDEVSEVYIGQAAQRDLVNEELWIKTKNFVAGVVVVFWGREDRGMS